eukprot:7196842-Prymnesium_polylepis.1
MGKSQPELALFGWKRAKSKFPVSRSSFHPLSGLLRCHFPNFQVSRPKSLGAWPTMRSANWELETANLSVTRLSGRGDAPTDSRPRFKSPTWQRGRSHRFQTTLQ